MVTVPSLGGGLEGKNILFFCTGNPLDEVEAELRGVRDAVSVDNRVDDVERRDRGQHEYCTHVPVRQQPVGLGGVRTGW